MRLLLASRSAARRRMLEAAGVAFEAVDAPFEEESAKIALAGLGAAALAAALAERKALAVSTAPGDLVLGSDQTLETDDGLMFNKPGSRGEAFEQLRALSGRTHKLHSAAVIVRDGAPIWDALQTVNMVVRPLSDAFIDTYLEAEFDALRWSVGCYHLEERGAQLFERIEGSHFAVLGLPLLPLLAFLRERGVMAS